MSTITDKLTSQLSCKFNWVEIKPKEYASYGIANMEEAQVIYSYKVGTIYSAFNTLTLYDYGKDDKFIKNLFSSYNELGKNSAEQQELGIKPIHWELGKNNFMLSVIKVIARQEISVVDVFFVYQSNVFCFHTYLPGDEKDYSIENLTKKYSVIDHIVKEIDGLKK